MRKMLAVTLSAASLLAGPAVLITTAIATPASAQSAPTVQSVRSAIESAIRAAQAANRASGTTGAAAEANIQAAIQQAVIASNAPPTMVQAALSSLPANLTRLPGVAAAVAQVQQTVGVAVAQNSSTSGAASTGGSSGASATVSAGSFGGSGGGGGGGDYRPN